MEDCGCNDHTRLVDAEADDFVEHLLEEAAPPDAELAYRCPYTLHQWVGTHERTDTGEHFELRRISEGERELRPQQPDP